MSGERLGADAESGAGQQRRPRDADLDERIAERISQRRGGSGRHARSRAGPTTSPRRPGSRRPLSFAVRLVTVLAVAAAIALGLRAYVVEPFWIPSQSMEPTLHGCPGCDDDRLLVDKLSYDLHGVDRGDVVVFHRPPSFAAAENDLVKRVIGLPGETVSGHDGRVWIGDRPLREPYVAADCHGTADFAPVTVPPNEVFVMGDNRCDSSDSRVFGPIRESSIIGRAFLVFWPIPRIHWL